MAIAQNSIMAIMDNRMKKGLKWIGLFMLMASPVACLAVRGEDRAGNFLPPHSGFFVSSGEKPVRLDVKDSTAGEANRLIAAARPQTSGDPLIVQLRGKLLVGGEPLRIPSRTALILQPGACIVADRDATAPALMTIDDAEYVLITSQEGLAQLDGRKQVSTGIRVRTAGRIAIDKLEIRQCAMAGIDYAGRGEERLGDAGAVTRCRISGCATGLVVRNAGQFVCLENAFKDCSAKGIDVNTAGGLFVLNDIEGSAVGVEGVLKDVVMARNNATRNGVGIRLLEGGTDNLVSENRVCRNQTGLEVNGTLTTVLGNQLDNQQDMILTGSANFLVANQYVSWEGPVDRRNTLFNPPTLRNPHREKTIVSGKGRFDLVLSGGGKLSDVQAALVKARREQVGAVIVAHLKGLFEADGKGPSGLALPDDTCVILDGEIQAENDQLREVVLMAGRGCASFSGGVIDCHGKGLPGKYNGLAINVPGRNIALIDAVTVRNSRIDAIMTKGHTYRDGAVIIRDCTVENAGARAIWGHVARNVVALNNLCRGAKMDGIDIDANCQHARVIGNRCENNGRHGVFVEEAVRGTVVYANRLAGNGGQGIHVWNQEVTGNTGPNLLACNVCEKNRRGMGVGGRTAGMSAHGNVFFNNICRANQQGISVARNAEDNFFCHTVLEDNGENMLDWTGKSGGIAWLGWPTIQTSQSERK